MLNRIFIMGRLVADPELRTTPGGVPVATIRLAVDRDYKNKQTGERETDFINVVAWQQTAEFVSRYFSKGRMAVVEGRLQVRSYVDRDNIKRVAAEVVANNIYFGDSKRDSDGGSAYGGVSTYAGAPAGGGYSVPAGGNYAGAPAGGYPAPAGGNYGSAPVSPGYGAPDQGDQYSELTDDDGPLPF